MRHLVLDPGLKTGLAFFEDKKLIGYTVLIAQGKNWESKTRDITDKLVCLWPYWEPHKLFIEWPQTHFRGNIKSLIKLAFLIGRVVEVWSGPVELIPVHKWKQNLPKEITWRRAEKFFKVAGLKADSGDAVAIGHYLVRNNLI